MWLNEGAWPVRYGFHRGLTGGVACRGGVAYGDGLGVRGAWLMEILG